MITSLIVAVLFEIIFAWDFYHLGPIGRWALPVIAIAIFIVPYKVSNNRTPWEDYTRINSYTYVTEDGVEEKIIDTFYKKDGEYYTKDDSRARWIPFAAYEFVKVELPESAIDIWQECLECGEPCSTSFCGYCGAEMQS